MTSVKWRIWSRTKSSKTYAEYHGFSQVLVRTALAFAQQTYFDYENGRNDIPSRYMRMLADSYHVSANCVLGRTDYPEIQADLDKRIRADAAFGLKSGTEKAKPAAFAGS